MIDETEVQEAHLNLLPVIKPKGPCSGYLMYTTEHLTNPSKALLELDHKEKIKKLGA